MLSAVNVYNIVYILPITVVPEIFAKQNFHGTTHLLYQCILMSNGNDILRNDPVVVRLLLLCSLQNFCKIIINVAMLGSHL